MVLHNISANASSNQAPQVRQSLVKDGSFQDFTKNSGISIDLSSLNDDSTNQLASELSDYTGAYQNVLNNVDNSKASQIKSLLKNTDGSNISNNVDNQTITNDADKLNQLAGPINDASEQSDQEVAQGNAKNKADAIRNTFQHHNTSTVTLSGQTYDVTKMSDNDVISLANKLSDFTYAYSNILSNDSSQKSTSIKDLAKQDLHVDQLAPSDSDDSVANIVNKLVGVANSVQSTVESSGYTSAKDDATKASLIKDTLNKTGSKNTPYIGGSTLNPDKLSNDNDALNLGNNLYNFAKDYQKATSQNDDPQVDALTPYLKNGDASNLAGKNNGDITQMGKDTNSLAFDVKSNIPNDATTDESNHHKADKIRGVLNDKQAKDFSATAGAKLDPSNLSDNDALSLINNLSQFTSDYQNAQSNANTNLASQLKPLIKKVNNADVSSKDDATVIQLGADLNQAAKNVQSNEAQTSGNNNGGSSQGSNNGQNNGSNGQPSNSGNGSGQADHSGNNGSGDAHSSNGSNNGSNGSSNSSNGSNPSNGSNNANNSNNPSNGSNASNNSSSSNGSNNSSNTGSSSNTSGGGSVVTNPSNNSSNNNSSNNNSSNNSYNHFNDGSKEAGFPSAPKGSDSSDQPVSHPKKAKVSAKQLKKDKAAIKKAQKHLKKYQKQVKKAKGHTNKSKAKDGLKVAEKAVAHAEIKYNHDKKLAK